MVRRLGLGKNNHLTYASLALNPRYAQQPRNEDQKLLILYDAHWSHVCSPVIEWARENNITLFILPPHCSHFLQPLDIGCFSPLKAKFNQECQSLFVCVEVLRPSQPNGVMSSTVSLPNHTFTGQA